MYKYVTQCSLWIMHLVPFILQWMQCLSHPMSESSLFSPVCGWRVCLQWLCGFLSGLPRLPQLISLEANLINVLLVQCLVYCWVWFLVHCCSNSKSELGMIASASITPGTPGQACPSGFTLDAAGPFCQDNNECGTSSNRCSHGCTNTVGSYVCTCTPGFTLGPDGYTCQGAQAFIVEGSASRIMFTQLDASFGSLCSTPDPQFPTPIAAAPGHQTKEFKNQKLQQCGILK